MRIPSACILLPHPLETFGQAKVRDLYVVPRRFSWRFSAAFSPKRLGVGCAAERLGP